jgi:hypothetical protein
MTNCEICGAELQDRSQRFCGGDRCLHVVMRPRRREAPASWEPIELALGESLLDNEVFALEVSQLSKA